MKTLYVLAIFVLSVLAAGAQTQTITIRSGPNTGFRAYRGAGHNASPNWMLPSYNDASWLQPVNGSVPDTSIGGSCNGANWSIWGQRDTAIWTDVTTHFPDTGAFRKPFKMCGTPISCTMKVIGDDYATTYINGNLLGNQQAAVTGMIYTLNATQLTWFQQCNNVIAVQVSNLQRYCAAFDMVATLVVDTTGCAHRQPGSSATTAAICAGGSYTFGGRTYTQAGTYYDTIGTTLCDSIARLDLFVTPYVRDSVSQLICAGQSVTVGTHTYSAAGVYRDTFALAGGCDSIHILRLAIGTGPVVTAIRYICPGQTVTVGPHTYYMTGVYRDTFATAACDSIYVLDLRVSLITDSVAQRICTGQSVTVGTHTYTTTGVYRDTFARATCDSVHILSLTVASLLYDSAARHICTGQYVTVGTHTYSTPGIYRDTFATATCDSVYVLHLSVTGILTDSAYQAICQGQSVQVGTHTYTATGIYRDTFATSGCDSVHILDLYVRPLTYDSGSQTICAGHSVMIGTHLYTSTGTYRDTFATTGCDSIYTLHLTVLPVGTDSVSVRICPGQSYTFGTRTYTSSGTYRDTVPTAGCDSVHILHLTVDLARDTAEVYYCPGQSVIVGGQVYSSPGFYSDTVAGTQCDIIHSLAVQPWTVVPLQIYASDTLIEPGDTIYLGTGGTYHDYTWTSTSGQISTHAPSTAATPTQSGWITLQVTDTNNCTTTDSIYIRVGCQGVIYVPNAFTPNGDGINDQYYIVGHCITLHEFKIFNRWGEKVWETDDINARWDGRYHGDMQPAEVYVYFLSYTDNSGRGGIARHTRGSITLIR
ncbi:MAG: gliding motility-associated C-terminal domain-containing protein [Bacteroidetes bacterium]|nr:gliding motility-associated C-terminal domain-containing protein [Bacteroidota bacterium]